MPMFKPISENEATGKVIEVFDEIKSARQITEVPNFWKMLANDPNELERTWSSLKEMFAVVGLANKNNKLVEAYQVEVDDIYK